MQNLRGTGYATLLLTRRLAHIYIGPADHVILMFY